jgi:hypothetical protein
LNELPVLSFSERELATKIEKINKSQCLHEQTKQKEPVILQIKSKQAQLLTV